jgi:peptidylprolyl isomerase/peptidyl-prolyl cis-trans isomerase D
VPIDTFKNVNFNMSFLEGLGNETAVIGRVSVMKVGEVSKPIKGQAGVFIVECINRSEPAPTSDLASYQRQSAMVSRGSIDSRLMEAVKAEATLKDNRYKFY